MQCIAANVSEQKMDNRFIMRFNCDNSTKENIETKIGEFRFSFEFRAIDMCDFFLLSYRHLDFFTCVIYSGFTPLASI